MTVTKMGRPKKDPALRMSKPVGLRLTPDEWRGFQEAMRQEGVNASELARKIVSEELRKRGFLP